MMTPDPRDLVSRVNKIGGKSTLFPPIFRSWRSSLRTSATPPHARRQGAWATIRIAGALILCGFILSAATVAASSAHWPQWRGPLFNGVAPDAAPPAEWSENQVAWKTPLPGLGHSTPLIIGDYLYLTTAVPVDEPADSDTFAQQFADIQEWQRDRIRTTENVHNYVVMAINRINGTVAWQTVVHTQAPVHRTHSGGSWASASPVTDGKHIYAWFGSYGLYCLNMQGQVLWSKDFGILRMKNHFGEGASPAIYGDRLIIASDTEDDSFIAVLDTADGSEIWRHERDEQTSWATPLVLKSADGEPEVIISATRRIKSYRLADGTVNWQTTGMTANVVPHPVSDGELLFVMSGFRGNALLAIEQNQARGDFSESHEFVRWQRNRNTPYVPSPVLHNGLLYFLERNNGRITCVRAANGEPLYENIVIDGLAGVYASPLLANGRLYIPDLEGNIAVLAAGEEYQLLHMNTLPDQFTASPVAIGRDLYLRGHNKLWCIRAEE